MQHLQRFAGAVSVTCSHGPAAIAAVALGQVERLIGTADQVIDVFVFCAFGDADTDRRAGLRR